MTTPATKPCASCGAPVADAALGRGALEDPDGRRYCSPCAGKLTASDRPESQTLRAVNRPVKQSSVRITPANRQPAVTRTARSASPAQPAKPAATPREESVRIIIPPGDRKASTRVTPAVKLPAEPAAAAQEEVKIIPPQAPGAPRAAVTRMTPVVKPPAPAAAAAPAAKAVSARTSAPDAQPPKKVVSTRQVPKPPAPAPAEEKAPPAAVEAPKRVSTRVAPGKGASGSGLKPGKSSDSGAKPLGKASQRMSGRAMLPWYLRMSRNQLIGVLVGGGVGLILIVVVMIAIFKKPSGNQQSKAPVVMSSSRARQLFKEGDDLARQGKSEEALKKMREALEVAQAAKDESLATEINRQMFAIRKGMIVNVR